MCLCVKFHYCPKESHLSAIKIIFKFFKRSIDLCLQYPKNINLDLISYSDVDFVDCKMDRKITSGTCYFLGHSLVSWHSKKQILVELYVEKVECIVISLCCAQIL